MDGIKLTVSCKDDMMRNKIYAEFYNTFNTAYSELLDAGKIDITVDHDNQAIIVIITDPKLAKETKASYSGLGIKNKAKLTALKMFGVKFKVEDYGKPTSENQA